MKNYLEVMTRGEALNCVTKANNGMSVKTYLPDKDVSRDKNAGGRASKNTKSADKTGAPDRPLIQPSKASVTLGDLRDDQETAYIMLNTWLSIIPASCEHVVPIFSDLLREKGLSHVVKHCDDIRNYIVRLDIDDPTKPLDDVTWIQSIVEYPLNWAFESLVSRMPVAQLLFFLGYPKRISLNCVDPTNDYLEFVKGDISLMLAERTWFLRECLYHHKAVTELTEANADEFFSSTGSYSVRTGIPYSAVSEHTTIPSSDSLLMQMLCQEFNDIFKDYHRDDSLFCLPPGATAELPGKAATYLNKYKRLGMVQQTIRDAGYCVPLITTLSTGTRRIGFVNRVTDVPKNAFHKRLIAPEPTGNQYIGYQVDKDLRRCLRAYGVDLSDQEMNQIFARIGSYYGTFATIDLHAASDFVSRLLTMILLRNCTNEDLVKDLLFCRTTHTYIKLPGNKELFFKSHRHATMGNTITFSLESAVFLCIIRVAARLYYSFGKKKRISARKLTDMLRELIRVYGDDIAVHIDLAPTVIDLLRIFGFVINEDKTFTTGSYRESCGAEFIHGYDVSHVRYPRGTAHNRLSELVSLQHKLVGYPRADRFLQVEIRNIQPNITTSAVGTFHDDIWDVGYTRKPTKGSKYVATSWRKSGEYDVCDAHVTVSCERLSFKDWLREKIDSDPTYSRSKSHKVSIQGRRDYDSFYSNSCGTSFKMTYPSFGDFKKASVKMGSDYKEEPTPLFAFLRKWYNIKIQRSRVNEHPGKADVTLHTTFVAQNACDLSKIKETDRTLLEELGLNMTLGGGSQHINENPYTKLEDKILDRRSLYGKNSMKVELKDYFD